jgi:hypothetical protein
MDKMERDQHHVVYVFRTESSKELGRKKPRQDSVSSE